MRKLVVKTFDNRINAVKNKGAIIESTLRLYKHELTSAYESPDFDEAYYRDLVESTSPVISGLYEKQDEENGSIEDSIYETALFTAFMCVTSRVYEELDAIFARDCIHAGLEAAHYLMVSKIDIGALSEKEKLAMLWAFSELSKTDVEIKNAYDHSLMAGMPQKMSRQKKYKMTVNALSEDLCSGSILEKLLESSASADTDGSLEFDLLIFAVQTILLDSEDDFSEKAVSLVRDMLINTADKYAENSAPTLELSVNGLLYMTGALVIKHILSKNEEDAGKSDAQLIKVIEYNVINNKKKLLSEEEKNEFLNKLTKYEAMI